MSSSQHDRLHALCTDRLDRLEQQQLRRQLPHATPGHQEDKPFLSFASNNYLGLADHPDVVAAGQQALQQWGVGAEASRLVTGNTWAHTQLEQTLAALKGQEQALVFSSGYAANVGVITALAGPRDHVLADRLSHASLIDGCRQAHARLRLYPHNDLKRLKEMLEDVPSRGQTFIVTDGVFSMDGEMAPIPDLVALAEQHKATLVVDDAHGTGVVGPEGKGSVAFFDMEDQVAVQIGTLSKALGAQGGFVAGSQALIDLLVNKARSFIYSTGLSPAVAAAAHKALDIAREETGRRERLQEHLQYLRASLKQIGYTVRGTAPAPMIAVHIGDPGRALALAQELKAQGILAPAIRPPTVPEGTSRIRLAPMATHTREDLERLCKVLPSYHQL